jgi:serine/threonine protein kinase
MRINKHIMKENRTTDFVISSGTILKDRYEVRNLVYTGGMSYVYLVKDKSLYDRSCIIKEVREQIQSEAHRKQLEEEALRMATLSHPSIAMIFDHFVEQNHYFLVVEYIRGKSLSDVVKEGQGKIDENEVVKWGVAICDVVAYIHSQGILHRDISPDNIMLTKEGSIKFIDFGTLREYRHVSEGKTAGMGKYGYTPPEQWRGKPIPQSDIFAIGATMYQLLTGFLPLSKSYLTGHEPQSEDFFPRFPPITSRNPGVSLHLEAILEKSLQLEADKRYNSALEMRDDLSRLRRETYTGNPGSPVTVVLPAQPGKTSLGNSRFWFKRKTTNDDRNFKVVDKKRLRWKLSEGFSESAIRRKTVSNTLQLPATQTPLAVCILSTTYMVLLSPIFGFQLATGIIIGVSGAGALVSYAVNYPREYQKNSDELRIFLEDEHRLMEEAELNRLQLTLQTGFLSVSSMEGTTALDELSNEYQQLQSALEQQRATDPLSMSVIPALTGETYRRGLSVLSDALDLMNVINTPSREKLEREIIMIEKEVEALQNDPLEAERFKLKKEILESSKYRITTLGKLQLWVEQLLYQARRCEDALHSTRIELATIRAGATKISVDSVVQTLQERINQVKEVQDEITRLGY